MKLPKNILILVFVLLLIFILIYVPLNKKNVEEKRSYCPEESRNVEACIEIYQPVCGWFNPEEIVCVKYPCAVTFSNSCFACQSEDILYYTNGECPI